jgi:hypothetical protein
MTFAPDFLMACYVDVSMLHGSDADDDAVLIKRTAHDVMWHYSYI